MILLAINAVSIGLRLFANAQSSNVGLLCPSITADALGNSTEFSTSGLISQAISGGSSLIPVKLGSQFRVLCDASGSMRGTSSFVSVLAEFQCSSASIADCNGTTMLTRQFQFQCSTSNEYSTTIVDTDTYAVTLSSTATFSTIPDTRCRACIDDQQVPMVTGIHNDTHCLGRCCMIVLSIMQR